MKISTKQYVDNQIGWVKELMEEKDKAAREAVRIYNANMDSWKAGHNEWKTRMEQLTSQTVTRREAWIFIIAMVTFAISLLGIAVVVAISLKK
jgi:hypothetical protein